jgi:hypothetical protein
MAGCRSASGYLHQLQQLGANMNVRQSLLAAAALGALVSPIYFAAAQTAAPTSNGGDAQSPLGAAGGLLAAMGGALKGNHQNDTVDFHLLKVLLPASLPGMKRTFAQGENREEIGVKSATAKADYQGGQASVHVTISDLAGMAGLLDVSNGLVKDTESESDTGYEKNARVGGRTVHEKYDTQAKSGAVSIILVRRYQVEVSGEHADMQTLEQALGQVDLAKLEAMKDAGAPAK